MLTIVQVACMPGAIATSPSDETLSGLPAASAHAQLRTRIARNSGMVCRLRCSRRCVFPPDGRFPVRPSSRATQRYTHSRVRMARPGRFHSRLPRPQMTLPGVGRRRRPTMLTDSRRPAARECRRSRGCCPRFLRASNSARRPVRPASRMPRSVRRTRFPRCYPR